MPSAFYVNYPPDFMGVNPNTILVYYENSGDEALLEEMREIFFETLSPFEQFDKLVEIARTDSG